MTQIGRLSRVVLDDEAPANLPPLIEADREQAVADIVHASRFVPLTRKTGPICNGPFALHLALRDGRMVLDIRCDDDSPVLAIGLALGPFRSLIKDYHLLVDSHIKAVEEGRMEHIQAVDMGRRGLHDEGAELLRRRLHGKVDIDFDTARRLFTLLCVLHQKVAAR